MWWLLCTALQMPQGALQHPPMHPYVSTRCSLCLFLRHTHAEILLLLLLLLLGAGTGTQWLTSAQIG
jgi:hypothetical protein